jgi:hypothetical protein
VALSHFIGVFLVDCEAAIIIIINTDIFLSVEKGTEGQNKFSK